MKVDHKTHNTDVTAAKEAIKSSGAEHKHAAAKDNFDSSSKMPSIGADGTVVLPDESNTSIADMQKQIQFLQSSIDASKPDAVQKIYAAQQQIMVAQVAAMSKGSGAAATPTTPSAPSAPAAPSTPAAPVAPAAASGSKSTASTASSNTNHDAPAAKPVAPTQTSTPAAKTSGSYQGDGLTKTPGPGVQGVFGKKAYGPNTPQGAQPADPYPYIGTKYSGPASNFPPASKWLDFDTLFAKATPIMKAHGDTDAQIAMIKKGIEASGDKLDPRVTLCVMMKESGGALNAGTTYSASGGANPGLFQSDGGSTFNPADPQGSINKMISDGIEGTGPDKTSLIHALQVTGGNIYEALRGYNSGLWGGIANLDNLSYRPGTPPAGDTAYVSNFANLITTGQFV